MNIKKKCKQINSLLGDLSSTGITPIPNIVYEMRILLRKIEAVAEIDEIEFDKIEKEVLGKIATGEIRTCTAQEEAEASMRLSKDE